jgi:hypothetical protein
MFRGNLRRDYCVRVDGNNSDTSEKLLALPDICRKLVMYYI